MCPKEQNCDFLKNYLEYISVTYEAISLNKTTYVLYLQESDGMPSSSYGPSSICEQLCAVSLHQF
jgi:hypothetical protein